MKARIMNATLDAVWEVERLSRAVRGHWQWRKRLGLWPRPRPKRIASRSTEMTPPGVSRKSITRSN